MTRRSHGDHLVQLAISRYRFGRSDDGAAFAVPIKGPPLARVFRGSASALRAELAALYYEERGETPHTNALVEALSVLEGRALMGPPTRLHIRVAEEGAVWLDLGHPEGRFARVTDGGWTVETSVPVLFRHTPLTGPLPEPERGGDFEEFRDYVNLDDEQWDLVRGWAVGGLLPGRPQPILALIGRQGSGKSTIARRLADLLDPSPAPLRSPPRNDADWAVTASASYVVPLDNCSKIPDGLSDALCRAATGDGYVRRALYTDDGVAVSAFRRAVIITGIDLGALRGDLLDRAILLEPHPIGPDRRRQEHDLERRWALARGRILGGLLDLLAQTLAQLPQVRLSSRPRMADHAEVLAALDQATGTTGLDAYLRASSQALEDAIEGHPVAMAVQELMASRQAWGPATASQLLKALTPENPPRDWPTTSQHLSGQLRRAEPLLEEAGIQIETGLRHGDGHRGIRITRKPNEPLSLGATAQ